MWVETVMTDMYILLLCISLTGFGEIRSFRRSCEPWQYFDSECKEDEFFVTCTKYCAGTLCNSGVGSPVDWDKFAVTTGMYNLLT